MSIPRLHYRILQLAYKHKLGHLSSCLTAIDIIDSIYQSKAPRDLFVLSQGHAGLALYVALEKYEGRDAEQLYLKHRTHPHRDPDNGIHVSAGSLGCGLAIALGMAMADRTRNVHVLISDGECDSGACLETLKHKTVNGIDNLRIHANFNGQTTLRFLDLHELETMVLALDPTIQIYHTSCNRYRSLSGIVGHYKVLSEEDYKEIIGHA